MALIKTPHAAVIVWNYEDRISAKGFSSAFVKDTKINEIIISKISLMSISTTKSKSDPVGSFNFMLAPTRNWVATLTPGSWCAILMSNDPITKESIQAAQPTQLKMLGRIDAVRTNVSVDDSGARLTTYSVQGRDWGAVFENAVYVDPIVQDPSELGGTQANALYQQIVASVFDNNGDRNILSVSKNLYTIMSVLGHPLRLPETDRLFKATHEVSLPDEVVTFLYGSALGKNNFSDSQPIDFTDKPRDYVTAAPSTKFMDLLSLIWGPLREEGEDDYDHSNPYQTGSGWLDPGTLVGQHTIWALLQENCNYAMNELFTDMSWKNGAPEFRLYSRIKPFSYTDDPASEKIDRAMRSKFQNIASHLLDDESIVSVSAGVNWADKFNFLEIKPDLNELQVLGVTLKDKSQAFPGNNSASLVFDREGFRPMIFSVKQLPFVIDGPGRLIDSSLLQKWVLLAQEWYFDSHKLLNGTLNLHGTKEYIPVGDNIMFNAKLIGVTPNQNSSANNDEEIFVLAHVESIQHQFSVDNEGARSFQTSINFVRGILVNKHKQLIGSGTIDDLASKLSKVNSKNNVTVVPSEEE